MTKWYNIIGVEDLRIHLCNYVSHLERQDGKFYRRKIEELEKILANLKNFNETDLKPFYQIEERKINEALMWNKIAH